EVEVDVEEVRGPVVTASHDVLRPHLLRQGLAHTLLDHLSVRPVCGGLPACGLASHPPRRQYRPMDKSSGVGVLDKAAVVLSALEAGPATLAQLVAATHLARPTAHRLAVALEHHRLVSRDMQGRFVLGPRLAELAAAEKKRGLRDSIRVGATLAMLAGSAAQILLAWEEPDRLHRGLQGAKFTATILSGVRRRGWAQSVSEREVGVASVSAPVRAPSGRVIAAVSVSGPVERMSRQPGRLHAASVVAAANRLSDVLKKAEES